MSSQSGTCGLADQFQSNDQLDVPCFQNLPVVLDAAGTTAIQSTTNINNFWSYNLQNTNAGSSASSDYILLADNATTTTHYSDFGMNNSGGGLAPFASANAAYFYSTDNEVDIAALGTTGKVNVYATGGTATPAQVAQFVGVASAVDYLTVTPAATANPATCTLGVAGTDANINLSIQPKGNGSPILGTFGIAHAIYSFAVDGGVQGTITAATNSTIPANAILVASTVNSTTAVTSGGSATVAVGVTNTGGSTTTLLAATAKASASANAVISGVRTFAAPLKVTAAGQITFTIATADLTAGVIEVWVQYWQAAA